MSNRDLTFDLVRGLSIYSIVLGHCFLYLFGGISQDCILNKILGSFTVPLFMFVSGYLNYGSFDGRFVKLKSRFISMIIPFIFWSIFYILYDGCQSLSIFVSSLVNLIVAPDYPSPLWFLRTLFMQLLILYFCMKISKKYDIFLALGVYFILFIVRKLGFEGCDIKSILTNDLFFLLGYGIHKYKVRDSRYFVPLCIISIIIFVTLTVMREMPVDINAWSKSALFKVRSLFGIFSIFYIVQISTGFLKRSQMFLSIGTKTLEIYTTHFLVIFIIATIYSDLNIGFSYILIFITSFITMYLAILISGVIKRNRILAYIVYGKQK